MSNNILSRTKPTVYGTKRALALKSIRPKSNIGPNTELSIGDVVYPIPNPELGNFRILKPWEALERPIILMDRVLLGFVVIRNDSGLTMRYSKSSLFLVEQNSV